ncbi:chemotaxis protein CheD [Pararobbsia alpina]|nr:chemotaxis protein CheD [Pararobbsia alpina]
MSEQARRFRLTRGAPQPEPRPEPEPEAIVRIGEAKRASNGVLKATLGSCVGIGLLWRSRGRCALAHCLLPDAPPSGGPLSAFGARYVEHALPVLFRLLEIERGAHGELEAVLVGGASLAKLGRGAAGQIGQHNVEAARARLAEAGIRIVLEQTGGVRGWQIMLDAAQMLYSAREIAVPHDRMTSPDEASYGHGRTR